MAGGTAGAVGDGRVIVALVVEMAAQATAAEEIVGEASASLGESDSGISTIDCRSVVAPKARRTRLTRFSE